jgi:DNA-binding NarL/FixJ family response regulator
MSFTSDTATIRILVVDDHGVVRVGVRRLVTDIPGCEVCGEAGTAHDAIEQAKFTRPDMIVLDIGLPDGDGLDVIRTLRAQVARARILVLTMYDEPTLVGRALTAGADGYLVKYAAEGELVAAIGALRRGERYVYPPLGAAMIQAASSKPDVPLNEREREIVRLLALGHTNAEIARRVHLSTRTVETHRAHALATLRLSTRADLVRWALERGMLDDVT